MALLKRVTSDESDYYERDHCIDFIQWVVPLVKDNLSREDTLFTICIRKETVVTISSINHFDVFIIILYYMYL